MIESPSSTDVNELCDWAELQALSSPRNSCTGGDIEKYVRPDDSVLEVDPDVNSNDSDPDEGIASDVLGLALKRSLVLKDAYPFTVEHNAIRRRPARLRTHTPSEELYLYCLCLSGLASDYIGLRPRELFEIEMKHALESFLGGDAFHFGWARGADATGKILQRIQMFCHRSKLSWLPHPNPRVSTRNNDAGIDVILWKKPPDERENALVFLAQCASGRNWIHKLTSSTDRLLTEYLQHQPSAPTCQCFCTPFHIVDNWNDAAVRVRGLLFDRVRLVLVSGESSRSGALAEGETRKWLAEVLKELRSSEAQTRRPGRTNTRASISPRRRGSR